MIRSFQFVLLMLIMGLMLSLPQQVHAVQPDEILQDPKLEARARALSATLRCVVCQNQSIDDSNAALARDFRILLRERISIGDSDEEAIKFLVDRYGAYILLKPPFSIQTILLWVGPLLLLTAAIAGFHHLWRKNHVTVSPEMPELTDEEFELVQTVLKREDL